MANIVQKSPQQANPIFELLERVKTNKLKRLDIRSQLIQKGQSPNRYFLFELPASKRELTLQSRSYQLLNHHVTIYEKCNDRKFGLSAFHYTAELTCGGAKSKLHIYFDRNNRSKDCLLQDQSGATIDVQFDHEQDLTELARQHMQPIMGRVFNVMFMAEADHKARVSELQAKIDSVSKIVFQKKLQYMPQSEHHKHYLSLVREYCTVQKAFNKIALVPDKGVIACLESAIDYFKNPPQPEAEPKPSTPQQQKKPQQTKSVVTKKNAARPNTGKSKPQPQKNKALQALQQKLVKLRKQKSDTSRQCHELRLLQQCYQKAQGWDALQYLLECQKHEDSLEKRLVICARLGMRDDVLMLIKVLPRVWLHDAIVSAAVSDKVEVLRCLLKQYQGPMVFAYESLHLMAYLKLTTPSLIALLEHGADANVLTRSGFSLLYRACDAGDLERAAALLKYGAEIDRPTKGYSLSVASLSQHHKGGMRVDKKKTREVAQYQKSDQGAHFRTPLMAAVRSGCLPLVQLLLDSGANLACRDVDDFNAFDLAITPSNASSKFAPDIVSYLIEQHGCDINQYYGMVGKVKCGANALIYAVMRDNVAFVRGLLALGADPNQLVDMGGVKPTPLTYAAGMKKFDLVTLIMAESKIQLEPRMIQHCLMVCTSNKSVIVPLVLAMNKSGKYLVVPDQDYKSFKLKIACDLSEADTYITKSMLLGM